MVQKKKLNLMKQMRASNKMSYQSYLIKKLNIQEDGHTDVASMKNKVKVAMAALEKMQTELDKLGDEDSLPTWWTNKVAVAVTDLDKATDFMSAKEDNK